VKNKQVSADLGFIVNKARSVGIHLILSTQYPTKDVLNSQIQNGCSARLAFRLTEPRNYLTVLGRVNNKELATGEFLYKHSNGIEEGSCKELQKTELKQIINKSMEIWGVRQEVEVENIINFPNPEKKHLLVNELRGEGLTQVQIANALGLTQGAVSKILQRHQPVV
jgi:DNA segregation ATPase FtsK/SpoIIIE-like protein